MALPDPRKRILQQRAKERRLAQKESDKQLKIEQSVYKSSAVTNPNIIRLHTPFSYRGCNVYSISKSETLISEYDRCFLSIQKTDTGYSVCRYQSGTFLFEQNQPYEQIDAQSIRSIIDRAFSL